MTTFSSQYRLSYVVLCLLASTPPVEQAVSHKELLLLIYPLRTQSKQRSRATYLTVVLIIAEVHPQY